MKALQFLEYDYALKQGRYPSYIEEIAKSIEKEYNNQFEEQKNLSSPKNSHEQKIEQTKEANEQILTHNSSQFSAIMNRINELYKQQTGKDLVPSLSKKSNNMDGIHNESQPLINVRDVITEAVEERKELSQVINQKEKGMNWKC
ncbi:hypothetical protein [Hazenella coriacea]|nr:hypothetical protein [Hazenella coriacea]